MLAALLPTQAMSIRNCIVLEAASRPSLGAKHRCTSRFWALTAMTGTAASRSRSAV